MQFEPSFVDHVRKSEIVRKLTEEKTLELDNSEFSKWSSCFVQGLYYGALKRINAKGQTPLIFGRAVHEGLARRLAGEEQNDAIKAAVTIAVEDGLDNYLDPSRNTERLVELLVSYFIHCDASGEWIRPVVVAGKPLVEQSFCLELGHVIVGDTIYKINWKGKLDVFTRRDGDLWIVDHKTTSVMGEKFMDDKLRGNQFLGYTWAGNHIAEPFGEQVKGVIVNALAMRKNGFEFKQFAVPYSDLVLNEWVSETIAACGVIIRDLLALSGEVFTDRPATIVANRESCVTKYGRCQYFDVCEMVGVMRERILFDESYFKEQSWDPLD